MKLWYAFSEGRTDGNRTMVDSLGGKGANLAEMCNLGIPVPPGFTLPGEICSLYYHNAQELPGLVVEAVHEGISHIEKKVPGFIFGDREKPLLVSVRSGARVSMPGMMDTVLNIGLTDVTVEGLAKSSGNRRFALDSYRRLIQMYGDVVAGIDRAKLDAPLTKIKSRLGYNSENDFKEEDLGSLIDELKSIYKTESAQSFPQDPGEQLLGAVRAVFGSWMTKRAQTYRKLNGISASWGTAANVQAMVFGNFGEGSGTGVAFSRNPSTGEKRVLGEWLPNAQGEDVVAGIRTPGVLHQADDPDGSVAGSLEKALPGVYAELLRVIEVLEKHYADLQDVEFTIQDRVLYLLQTRNGKRTAQAALKISVDMVKEDLIDIRTALGRVTCEQVDQLLHPQLDRSMLSAPVAKGLPASPGAASGRVVLSSDKAEEWSNNGFDVILVRRETSPEDIHGMYAAKGILTATGGMTSHAAVVARGMGRPCVAGCDSLFIDEVRGTIRFIGDTECRFFREGDSITLDGAEGTVFPDIVPTIKVGLDDNFEEFLGWADAVRGIEVRANADTPDDARTAVEQGAQGIGLCRTEHMFFAPERILAMREMILAGSEDSRRKALDKLLPMQREDFEGIFREMGDFPVTIRLLDPPLHEFLPHSEDELLDLATQSETKLDDLRMKLAGLRELNPMLGHRGCRLGLAYPEIIEMQTEAILEAAVRVSQEGLAVKPEIMVPLVMEAEELRRVRAIIKRVSLDVFARYDCAVEFRVGTMIELPRACLVADEIAEEADFFSFGTNDLTQTTMGVSRDDAGKFLPFYIESELLERDPFASLDTQGVGKLVTMACALGRAKKREIKIGVCGEHGGDPKSVAFFVEAGLDYVSCSPYRLPVARLAAAQAVIRRAEPK
ncbi:MAG: pyruvate, phosphate dikinase [Myxococcota bacterium]|nr:pyruvate, phosphate dikinase [Myxococcota bacterium]